MPIINELSALAFPIEIYFNDDPLGHATAFIWREHDINFLITNWHVIAGKNPITGELLDKTGGRRPNNIKLFGFHSDNISNRFVKTFDFYLNGKPQWYEHPIHREKVDVIAVALAPTDEFKVFPVNNFNISDLKIDIGGDVFALGYPFKPRKENFWLPVWKRGSIATEPDIDQDALPFLYVDSATRNGMSGSPVIIKNQGIGISSKNDILLGDTGFSFVGIFSGRLTGEESEIQLSRVWKSKVIAEIINGKCLGTIAQP